MIPETRARGWGLTAKETNEWSHERLTRPCRAVHAHHPLVQTKRLQRGKTGFLRSETREGQRQVISTGQPGGPRAAPGLAGTQEVKMYFLTKHRKGTPPTPRKPSLSSHTFPAIRGSPRQRNGEGAFSGSALRPAAPGGGCGGVWRVLHPPPPPRHALPVL